MKELVLCILSHFLCNCLCALNVSIIESSYLRPDLDMDTEWKNVCEKMGHTVSILPQSTLDNNDFFLTSDILIISSGEIELPISRANTILEFMKSGKPVYLQCEHSPEFSVNLAFQHIITSLGGAFTWKNLFQDDLYGIKVLGSFRDTKRNVKKLKYYWYSVSGEGDCRMIYFLQNGGEYHGFQYVPLNPAHGSIISTTDQDWVRETTSSKLMENIITHLISPDELNTNFLSVTLGNDTSLCIGDTLVLDATTQNATYTWQDNSTKPTLTISEAGTYYVAVMNNCGTAFDDIRVDFISDPKTNLKELYHLCDGEMVVLDATTPNGSYSWNDGTSNPTIYVDQEGSYLVEVNNGCQIDTFTAVVAFEDCHCSLFIPNVFSPNQDTRNDMLLPSSNCNLYSFALRIFDRWGNMVFNSNHPEDGWDGTFDGNYSPSGVYTFQLLYEFKSGKVITKFGDITLIR